MFFLQPKKVPAMLFVGLFICLICYYFTLGVYLTLKGIVHPKLKILSSFTHPVFLNLFECVCSAEHKGRYSEE